MKTLNPLTDVQKTMLMAMAGSNDGTLDLKQLKALYVVPNDGNRVAHLIRRGLAEWVRRDGHAFSRAIAIRITDLGRKEPCVVFDHANQQRIP